MTQPHIPAHDADSARDAETASAPSYPQRSTAQDHSATQELPAAQDATREMPSAATIPAPPAGAVPPASAPATPAPSAQEAPASGGTQQAPSVGGAYSAPSGQPYSGYTAPASPDAFASPTVIVTKKGPGWVALLGAMLLTIGLTLGAVFYARPAMLRASTPTNLNGGTVATVPASNSSGKDWTDVAAAVSPAVVTIQTQGASSGGTGSGVIYDAQGDIVTNYHVIAAAVQSGGKIQVTLADGRIYDAEVVGHDRTTDLAVIRLVNPPSDLTVARFGSSSHLTVGAPVMAIGAPLGLSKTVTTGIVSALNRPVEVAVDDDSSKNNGQGDSSDPFGQQKRNQSSSDTVITNAIQVDASLNPGNSGGPLFDQTGAVVGINSSIKSVTSSDGQAGSIGLGFAIPSDLVTSVADQLIAKGTVSHAVLGVNVTTAAVSVGGDTYAGAELADVTSGGAADKAGLRKGDVITQVEGQEVSSAKQLTGYIRRYKGGDTVKLTYVRDGASHEVQVALQAK